MNNRTWPALRPEGVNFLDRECALLGFTDVLLSWLAAKVTLWRLIQTRADLWSSTGRATDMEYFTAKKLMPLNSLQTSKKYSALPYRAAIP